jgi:hypothetical protein
MIEKGNPSAKPNPALKALDILIGEWNTTGSHPYFPGTTFHGKTSFKRIEGGAFIMMSSHTDENEIPDGMAIIGSDDSTEEFFMLYFDERNVSRKYDLSATGKTITWWRNAADFKQKNTLIISADGNSIEGKGQMCREGKEWEDDLSLNYTRIQGT